MRRVALALLGVSLLALGGCAEMNRLIGSKDEDAPVVGTLAVMPIERSGGADSKVPEGADRTVTSAIYGVLAESPRWRVVADLTVSDNLTALNASDDLGVRAYKMGKAVNADSVLFGTVSRFDERVGSDLGVARPAAVSISLKMISVAKRKIVWKSEFNEEQQSLSQNLFNFWQFWKGGARWFTAREFATMGVERMIEDLDASTQP